VPNSFQSTLPLAINIFVTIDIDMVVDDSGCGMLSAPARRERDHLSVKLDTVLIDDA